MKSFNAESNIEWKSKEAARVYPDLPEKDDRNSRLKFLRSVDAEAFARECVAGGVHKPPRIHV